MTGPVDVVPSVLAETGGWPVDTVAAAVVRRAADGSTSVATTGGRHRVFALASVSKLVTAYAVLIAVSEGCFTLDDTVGGVAAAGGRPVDGPQDATVRDLLAHASGVGFRDRTREKDAHVRRIYSSAGFEILADLVTVSVSEVGLDFAGYVDAAVRSPLGIPSAELVIGGSAGHGFRGSVGALTRLAVEFLSPTLLPEDLWDEALRPQFPDLDGVVPGYGRQRPCPWGLGVELHGHKSPHWLPPEMPGDVAGHFGQSGTFLWFHRATGTAAVVLTDRAFGDWARRRWDGFNSDLWAALQAPVV
ncbi:serine hydrolase [uncultured Corynebacterium sp.]|uniref:serine hydrolase domain-containing protein n=1 Tax=uncultured Corynebacterium sp. TaxID=159447 RepID=UPI0025E01B2A|nr:serine hydrolase [uncultured Corynebacterium sp.]